VARCAGEMERIGRCLGERLRGGDCVLLRGPVGVGKSVLARGAVRALLGDVRGREKVQSPSFLVERTYEMPPERSRGLVRHVDLYRLEQWSKTDFEALSWDHALFGDTDIVLVEWPEIARDAIVAQKRKKRGQGRLFEVEIAEHEKCEFSMGNDYARSIRLQSSRVSDDGASP